MDTLRASTFLQKICRPRYYQFKLIKIENSNLQSRIIFTLFEKLYLRRFLKLFIITWFFYKWGFHSNYSTRFLREESQGSRDDKLFSRTTPPVAQNKTSHHRGGFSSMDGYRTDAGKRVRPNGGGHSERIGCFDSHVLQLSEEWILQKRFVLSSLDINEKTRLNVFNCDWSFTFDFCIAETFT